MLVLPPSDWILKRTKHKGRGIYARVSVEPGTVIADYLGQIITHEQAEDKSELMGVVRSDDEVIWPAEIKDVGAHCINHSCAPNCGYYPYKGHVLVVSLRKIFPGEEFAVDYMMDPPTDYVPTPYYPCACHSRFCRSTMYTTLDHSHRYTYNFLFKKQGKYIKKLLVPYGEILPPFAKYPSNIKDEQIYTLFGAPDKKPVLLKDKKLPSIKVLRQLIRKNGTYLNFSKIGTKVFGIADGCVVSGS